MLNSRPMRTLTPEQLKPLLDAGQVVLLDVRQRAEWDFVRLPESTLIPLNELQERASELDRGKPIVVVCHHGVRSEQAARWLEKNGFEDVGNLAGGLEAWATEVDPSMARY